MTHATLQDEKNVKVVVNLQWANTFRSGNSPDRCNSWKTSGQAGQRMEIISV